MLACDRLGGMRAEAVTRHADPREIEAAEIASTLAPLAAEFVDDEVDIRNAGNELLRRHRAAHRAAAQDAPVAAGVLEVDDRKSGAGPSLRPEHARIHRAAEAMAEQDDGHLARPFRHADADGHRAGAGAIHPAGLVTGPGDVVAQAVDDGVRFSAAIRIRMIFMNFSSGRAEQGAR